jgi:protein TonB
MTAASIQVMAAGYVALPFSQSRPALVLVVIVHACCIFALAKLLDAHRIPLREPLIVELLETPKPEVEKPPPKDKPPEPKVEEPPPPQEKPPEPKAEEPPPPEQPVLKADVPPRPMPQADLPLPVPIVQAPPEPEPIQQQVTVDAPRVAPAQRIRHDPMPEPTPRRMPDPAPQPVVQRPVAPVIDPPSRPASPPQVVRERPLPPIHVAQAPAPIDVPRLPDPTLKVERDVPEARPVSLAPRELPRRPVAEKPTAVAAVHAPVQEAVAEPQPQVTILPEPPPGASAEVLDEIALGAEMLRANYLRNPKPLYPAISRRMKEQGTVLLRVFITAAGQPTQVILKTSSGFARLDSAAQHAVVGWKFVPATRDDKAVEAWVIVPIKFSLSN